MDIMKKSKHTLQVLVSVFKRKNIIPIIRLVSDAELLNGKVALIIGGSGGIGKAIAKTFSECGCKVIISGTNEGKLKKCCDEIDNSKYVIFDLKDISSLGKQIEKADIFFGNIDILVCSAGIHTNRSKFDFLNVTVADWDSVMEINLKGTYFMCQNMAKYMISKGIKGHILIISSQSALEPSWSPYRLSKLGVQGITKGIAQKLLPYGIIVNSIGPGPTATSMQDAFGENIYTSDNPIERFTMPEEIAEYAKLMVSDLGNTIVGDTLYMSGGRGVIELK